MIFGLIMITISPTHLTEIQDHGKEAYPYECCGAILGQVDTKEGTKIGTQILRIENNWQDQGEGETRHRRFAITAEDYRFLEKTAKQKELTLLGFYHTHPDHPAKPSGTDLSYAWPFFSYIILSVEKGQPKDIYSYELDTDKSEFFSEQLSIG